jgi:hypothetical protein
MNPIYIYKGTQYEIVREITDKDDEGRADQILIDFLHCEKVGDWNTIKNRMNGGLMWGWLKEIKEKKDEERFW